MSFKNKLRNSWKIKRRVSRALRRHHRVIKKRDLKVVLKMKKLGLKI